MKQAILSISKFDAARRQLETAIRLYFFHGDPVSIHTLASAAAQVLHDLGRNRGASPMMVRDLILQHIRPERHSEVKKALAVAENFFKHANKDPKAVLQFRLSQSELLLVDAVTAYRQLTSEQVPLFTVYWCWFVVEAGKELVLPTELEAVRKGGQRSFNTSSREAFFADVLPVAMSLGVQS